MLSPEILECIECVVPHNCTQDISCATCLIDYKFIACKPIMTECGHHVCEECVKKTNSANLKCKTCKSPIKSIGKLNKATELTVKAYLNELSKTLNDKFKSSLSLFEYRKFVVETEVGNKKQIIKDEIDLRIERLHAQLEDARKQLYEDLDEACLNFLSEFDDHDLNTKFTYREMLTDFDKCIQNKNIELNKFQQLQKSFKDLLDKIHKSYEISFEIEFEESYIESDCKTLIGELNLKDKEEKYPVEVSIPSTECNYSNMVTKLNETEKNFKILSLDSQENEIIIKDTHYKRPRRNYRNRKPKTEKEQDVEPNEHHTNYQRPKNSHNNNNNNQRPVHLYNNNNQRPVHHYNNNNKSQNPYDQNQRHQNNDNRRKPNNDNFRNHRNNQVRRYRDNSKWEDKSDDEITWSSFSQKVLVPTLCGISASVIEHVLNDK